MPEQTFWIQAVPIQPVPAIPRVYSGTLAMPILTVISLIAGQWRRQEVHAIGVPLQRLLLRPQRADPLPLAAAAALHPRSLFIRFHSRNQQSEQRWSCSEEIKDRDQGIKPAD